MKNQLLNSILVVIPARKGSKGIPGKNFKLLCGKPLIQYSIEYALIFFPPNQICISTDDDKIIALAEQMGIKSKFLRPDHLANDSSGMREVLLHAVENFPEPNQHFTHLLLLQP